MECLRHVLLLGLWLWPESSCITERGVGLALTGENVGLHCKRNLSQCVKGAGTPFNPTCCSQDRDTVRCLCRVTQGDGHVSVRTVT